MTVLADETGAGMYGTPIGLYGRGEGVYTGVIGEATGLNELTPAAELDPDGV